MLSLRLSPEQTRAIDEIAARQNLSRSEWLRQLIDRSIEERKPTPHEYYLQLMQGLSANKSAKRPADWGQRAQNHSQVIKQKLRAKSLTETRA